MASLTRYFTLEQTLPHGKTCPVPLYTLLLQAIKKASGENENIGTSKTVFEQFRGQFLRKGYDRVIPRTRYLLRAGEGVLQ